ncbi:MAG: permease-like cell division protein FtsX [Firmicutes bacterium]|nr:permease-like cell division protein FtsX [Bacillota bacterium]
MSRLFYNIKQAFQQIWRNKGMALASIFAIAAMMLILGIFFIMVVNLNLFTEMIKKDYDTIEVYLYDDVEEKDAAVMMSTIETFGGVKETAYRPKEEALGILKTRWGENGYLLDSLGDNPLPNSILVTVDSLDSAKSVYEKLGDLDGVEDISFYQETVEKLMRVSNFIQAGALILMAFLIIVSIVVVSNTIKLTVLARAREISIMKYIGATNWFIRGPFLVEGILIGIIASLIAAGITYLLYSQIIGLVGRQMLTMLGTPPVPASYLALNLVIIFVAMGVSIGASGSIVSMRRYLDK